MINKVEKRIQELEYGLPEKIRQVQLQNLPSVTEISLTEKDSYRYNGNIYTANGKRIFLAYNLPIKSAVNKKHVFNKTLKAAVDEDLIHPFILFINGKAIKWSNIDVVIDYKYAYLLINTDESIDGIIFHNGFDSGYINIDTGIIELDEEYPNSIYGEKLIFRKDVSYFITGHNSDDWAIREWDMSDNYIGTVVISGSGGYIFTPEEDIFVRVLFQNGVDTSNFKIIARYGESNHKIIKIPYRVRYGEDNIINTNYKGNFYFDSTGLLTTNTASISMRVEIISSELNCNSSDYANGYIEVTSDSYDKPAIKENIICFKNGIMSDESANLVDNGYNIFTHTGNIDGIIFKTFYYNKGNSSNDNLYRLNSTIIKNNIINNTVNPYMGKLKEKLNLEVTNSNDINQLSNIPLQNMNVIMIGDNKFLITFIDVATGNKGKAFVAEFVNGVLNIGPNYVFNNADTGSISTISIDADRALILFADASSNRNGKLLVVTISNTFLILGSVLNFSDASIFNLVSSKLDNNRFLVSYSDRNNSDYGTVQLIELDNDYLSIDYSPMYIFIPENISDISIVYVDNEKVCICYKDSIGFCCANIISIDDIGLIISNKYTLNIESASNISTVKVSNGRVLVTYISDQKAVAQLLNIDNNALSVLPMYIFNESTTTYLKMSMIDEYNLLVVFGSDSNPIYGILRIIDNEISYKIEGVLASNTIGEVACVGAYNKLYVIYTDTSNSNNGFIYNTYNSYNEFNMKLEKIMNYNPKLLESVYSELIPFEHITYTGAQINSRKDVNGYITMPRRRYNNIFCYVIIFVNGELYEKYDTITYINDKFKILIDTFISDTDTVEFIFVKDVDNSTAKLTIPSKDSPILINSKFNEDNMGLFSTEAEVIVKSGKIITMQNTNENEKFSLKITGNTSVIGVPDINTPAVLNSPSNVKIVTDKGSRNFVPNSQVEKSIDVDTGYIDYDLNPILINKLKGKTVTISAYIADSDSSHKVDMYLKDLDGDTQISNTNSNVFNVDGEYKRFSYSIIIPDLMGIIRLVLRVRGNVYVNGGSLNAGTFKVKNVKLEAGNELTPWTAALEDATKTAKMINLPYQFNSSGVTFDEITLDRKHIRRVGILNINGTNRFDAYNVMTNTTEYRINNVVIKSKGITSVINSISDRLTFVDSTWDVDVAYIYSISAGDPDTISVRLPNGVDPVTFFTDKPTTIFYELETPVITDISTVFPESFINNLGSDMYLYTLSDTTENPILNINRKRTYELGQDVVVNYHVPFSVKDNGDNTYNITLNNTFYYGRSLTVVSDKRFHYKKVTIEYNQVDVALGDEFKYCINKDNYMIFVNGRLINSDNFQVAVPGYYNPFDQVVLYINMILVPGNEIEVFYLPFKVIDTYTKDSLADIQGQNGDSSIDGDIQIDKSQIPFGLSKDSFWYFINGKKINPKDISDISDTRISITNNYGSTYNFLVVRFMNPIDIIAKMVGNSDTWSSIISLIGNNINQFYTHTVFTDDEIDIRTNETDMKATVLEAFRHYYAKYNISSNSLVYDFNDIVIDDNDMDSNGMHIIRTSDANKTNSVDVDR